MDAYALSEARFVQYLSQTSAANSLTAYVGPVPAGKVWTILAAGG